LILSRILDWFWLSSAERALRDQRTPLNERAGMFALRGRLARVIGRQALRPPEPYAEGKPDAVACELFRQSIHWSLLSYRELTSSRDGNALGPAERGTQSSGLGLRAIWDETDPQRLAAAAGGPELAAQLAREIVDRSFEDFAELEEPQQTDLAQRLDDFSGALLEPLIDKTQGMRRLWTTRFTRIGAACLLIALALVVVNARLEDWRDLARNRPWKASSAFEKDGCKSPAQICDEGPNFFFHTNNDDSPSIEFDLGRATEISGVIVENRLDCCQERAVPLVVEVSERPDEWRRVARRTAQFDTWRARFKRTHARWVRLRAQKKTYLHLARVRILP
jgi:hypothetical protein